VADDGTPAGSEVVGIIALALWWITVVAGLLILVRWLPSSGKHASSGTEDTWSEGPGLSILAHVGMLVGVCVFTYAYLTAKV
jgi:amino acid permease